MRQISAARHIRECDDIPRMSILICPHCGRILASKVEGSSEFPEFMPCDCDENPPVKTDEMLYRVGARHRRWIPDASEKRLVIITQQVKMSKLSEYEIADKTIQELYALGEGADISQYKGKIAKGGNYLILGDKVTSCMSEVKTGHWEYFKPNRGEKQN